MIGSIRLDGLSIGRVSLDGSAGSTGSLDWSARPSRRPPMASVPAPHWQAVLQPTTATVVVYSEFGQAHVALDIIIVPDARFPRRRRRRKRRPSDVSSEGDPEVVYRAACIESRLGDEDRENLESLKEAQYWERRVVPLTNEMDVSLAGSPFGLGNHTCISDHTADILVDELVEQQKALDFDSRWARPLIIHNLRLAA